MERKVSDLIDEAVSTSGIYFERAKEQVIFLYPGLDLSPMKFLKVICSIKFVDVKATTSPDLQDPVSLKTIYNEGDVKEGSESRDLHPEGIIGKKLTHKEELYFGVPYP